MEYLIIPMLIEAYASGNSRPSQRDIPVMSPNYKTVLANSVLGSLNTPGPNEKAAPLEAGIHLHFIIPDAFTHSPDGEVYPAVPNRYAVTRIWKCNGKLQAKCSIVESDFVSNDKEYSRSVTIPFFNDTDARKKWRYLGRNYPAGSSPAEGEYLDKLTAVGAGDPFFSAYYPNCRSVFGFYDDLSDLPPSQEISLTYFTVGYFSDASDDPFSGVKTAEDFANVLSSLSLSCDSTAQPRSQVVFYGAVENIEWKGFECDYANIPSGKVNIVLGNNSIEALSKTVVNNLGADSSISERMVSALQYELYDRISQIDGNFIIDDNIFYNEYSRRDSFDESPVISVNRETLLNTDKGLGKSLSDLKITGNKIGDFKRKLKFKRDELFTLWEQYIILYENDKSQKKGYPIRREFYDAISAIIDEIGDIENQISELSQEYEKKLKELSGILPAGASVEKNGNDFFFAPNEISVLFSGDGINRSFAFGEDGRFTSNGTLLCQLSPVCADIDGKELISLCFADTSYIESLPSFYTDLLVQTCLVCKTPLEAVNSITGGVKINGSLSSEIALNKNPFDFTTLFMIWGIEYRPTRTSQEYDNTLDDWEFEYGDTNLVYKGGLTPEKLKNYKISGQTVLSPHAVNTFGDVIKRYADIYGEDEKLKQLSELIKKLHIVSQSMSGFSEFFMGFRHVLQFPIMGIGGDDEIAGKVSKNINQYRRSIIPESDLLPIRGGYIKVTDLSLVSSFGLTQQLVQESYYRNCEVDFAETISCGIKDYGLIPPAFSDYTRIKADFISADDKMLYTSASPETSPICGIVVPEILNRRLLVFNMAGSYLGMLKTVSRNGNPAVTWISAPGLDNDFDKLDAGNNDFKEFLKNLFYGKNAFYEFCLLMDKFLDSKQGSEQILWGKPLVLARLKLKFEFEGEPQYQKRYEDFGKHNSLGVEKAAFRLCFGDMERISDGVFGYFEEGDFSKMYPAFGSVNPGDTDSYIKYSDKTSISNESGEKIFTLILEPDSLIHIQTGLIPLQVLQINSAHTKIAETLSLTAEVSSLLSSYNDAAIPDISHSDDVKYAWYSVEDDSLKKHNVVSPIVSFDETVLEDGFITSL